MTKKLGIVFNKRFGYCVDMRKECEWERESYDNYNNFSDFFSYFKDKEWIKFLGYDKDYYIDTLIKEFNAYQNATREFPRLFFKKKEDAERALRDFYEPALLLSVMSENY